MSIELRQYQSELNTAIQASWDVGNNNVLMVLPTGGGKTVCLSDIVHKTDGSVCVIAHRQELVSQISVTLARNGIRHRIIGPPKVIKMIVNIHMITLGKSFYDAGSHTAVAGVDTLIRRGKELSNWLPTVKLWVIDEAHHLLRANKWGKAVEMFPNARGLGMTATPLRADGQGLGAHADGEFHDMVAGPSMRDLINDGYLTEYRIFAPVNDAAWDDVRTSKVTGDLNKNDLGNVVSKSSLVSHTKATVTGDVVNHYLRIASGKLGITFVPTMEVGKEIEKQFNDAGVPAILVNAKTPDDQRAAILRKFANREYSQLINVDLFGEGFDLPALEVVSMVRKTDSYGLYVQMFGRVLRILAGKIHGIIIDHVGNVVRHGLPDATRIWTLDRRDKRAKNEQDDVTPVKACPECTSIYERYLKACPFCGHVPVPSLRSGPEHVDGDLSELDPDVLAQLRGEVAQVDKSINEQVDQYVTELNHYIKPMHKIAAVKRFTKSAQMQQGSLSLLRDSMAHWAGHHRHTADKIDDEIFKIFYLKFGVDWLSAQALPGQEMLVLNERIIKNIGVL